jgi:hypothetical protein
MPLLATNALISYSNLAFEKAQICVNLEKNISIPNVNSTPIGVQLLFFF